MTNTSRKSTARKATPKATPTVRVSKGTESTCKAAVTKWRAAGKTVDMEHAPNLLKVAVRLAECEHGKRGPVMVALGIKGDNEASRFVGAWKASQAFAKRNGTNAADAFPTFFVMSQNVGNADMITLAGSTSTLAAAKLAGNSHNVAKRAAGKARKANGSVLNGTSASKASDGTTGNAHAGTGDTSAAKNGDNGATVTDTLAAAIHSLASRVSDAVDNGTLDAKALRELARFEQVIGKARKASPAKPATPAKPVPVTA